MFPFPFLFLFVLVLRVTLNYIYNWAESRTTVNWQLLKCLGCVGEKGNCTWPKSVNIRKATVSNAGALRIRTVCRQQISCFAIINSMRNGSTVAWTISMTMTRSTPDQLIKIIVAALKLRQRGTCGMWQVQNWRASTRDATCECYTNYRQIMWQTRCFPDFPQQQPCQRNLSRANNKRNSSGAGIDGQREGERKEVAALVCVAQALPLLS